jgi:hypothetical protein
MRRLGYSFAAHAERVREHFICHRQLIRSEPIDAHQQPTAHLLIDGMAPIADRHLRYLSEQRVLEPEEQMLQCTAAAEFVLENFPLQAVNLAVVLNDPLVRCGSTAQDQVSPADVSRTERYRPTRFQSNAGSVARSLLCGAPPAGTKLLDMPMVSLCWYAGRFQARSTPFPTRNSTLCAVPHIGKSYRNKMTFEALAYRV